MDSETREFHMVFPADMRHVKNLDAIAQNIEGVINVALRENIDFISWGPPSVSLRLKVLENVDFIELTVSAKGVHLGARVHHHFQSLKP